MEKTPNAESEMDCNDRNFAQKIANLMIKYAYVFSAQGSIVLL